MTEKIKLVCQCQRCQQIFESIAPKMCPFCGCGEVKQVKVQKFTKEVTLKGLGILVPVEKTIQVNFKSEKKTIQQEALQKRNDAEFAKSQHHKKVK
jgi:hypothetical protein